MNLRQIIMEDEYAEESSFWKRYFEGYPTKDGKPDYDKWMFKGQGGWNFETDLHLKIGVRAAGDLENLQLNEIPYKIKSVRGTCSLADLGLKSMKNLPDEVGGRLSLYDNKIASLDTSHYMTVTKLDLAKNPIRNLVGLNTSNLEQLNLSSCKSLENLEGIGNIKIDQLSLANLSVFTDDLYKYRKQIKTVALTSVEQCPNMPLVRLVLFDEPRIKLLGISGGQPKVSNITNNNGLKPILEKYHKKGADEAINFIYELRAAGFKGHARTP